MKCIFLELFTAISFEGWGKFTKIKWNAQKSVGKYFSQKLHSETSHSARDVIYTLVLYPFLRWHTLTIMVYLAITVQYIIVHHVEKVSLKHDFSTLWKFCEDFQTLNDNPFELILFVNCCYLRESFSMFDENAEWWRVFSQCPYFFCQAYTVHHLLLVPSGFTFF